MATEYQTETVFAWGAAPLKFGVGALDEIGFDLGQMGLSRVLIVTDEGVAATGIPRRGAGSIQAAGLKPTALGGGPSSDPAKAITLLPPTPGDLMDYVNKPVGGGKAPTEPLKPLIAVPTTAGTGSESTAMCILDVLALRGKTGTSPP